MYLLCGEFYTFLNIYLRHCKKCIQSSWIETFYLDWWSYNWTIFSDVWTCDAIRDMEKTASNFD